MNRRISLLGLGAAAVVALPLASNIPVLANIREFGTTLAANLQAPKPLVKLVLTGEKQVVTKDAQGKSVTQWQSVSDKVTAQPGDVLRYTLTSKNEGKAAAKQLVLTQPIPNGTQYVLNSAIATTDIPVTYSIDGGTTFVKTPMVAVKLADGRVDQQPAPATMYTHVRWTVQSALTPNSALQATYKVSVK